MKNFSKFIKLSEENNIPQVIGVIPARFGSTRLIAKPLANIGGKPMIQHTFENARHSRLINKLIIAVDDKKVESVAKDFGAEVMMTPKKIASGSDRIAFVAKSISQAKIIVNIQGDEPFINPRMIDEAIAPLLFDKTVMVSTLAKKISTVSELKSPSVVKVVFDYNSNALYFSRSPIPYVRDARTNIDRIMNAEIFKHIGLYVFRREALLKFTEMPATDLEQTEKLEQLRLLENGIKIKVVVTEFDSFSVDTPEDLQKARIYYDRYLKMKAEE
ncbi:MAG: 3-deoxy-manno-octulosonate cytidylyltransferase [Ignavibacteriaceae bacterium]|nr:3-deoxy-manno-octulosonate cytidylyltransferase [Ignavibacteriaceae bacterium]